MKKIVIYIPQFFIEQLRKSNAICQYKIIYYSACRLIRKRIYSDIFLVLSLRQNYDLCNCFRPDFYAM